MFTGIVLQRGQIRRAKTRKGILELEIDAPSVAKELATGDSIAVDGVCLTAIATSRKRFVVQAMQETIARTTFDRLSAGAEVNLELPVCLSDRLGGHLVQGHVDGTAVVMRVEDEEASRRLWLTGPTGLLRYLVPKGSVTVDGVALTVTEVGVSSFGVAVIPHTLDVTTLGRLTPGSAVNIEVDLIAKYVERLVLPHDRRQ
jgi:riboflavin synthase